MHMKNIISFSTDSPILFGSCRFPGGGGERPENLDTYFKTEAEAESFVTGCYNALTFNGWWQVIALRDDQ